MAEHIIEFLGRTHLVVLHFPIALLIVAAMVEVCTALAPRLRRGPISGGYRPSRHAGLLFFISLLATVVSVITGLIFGFGDGSEVDLHRILGIVSGVLVLITGIALLMARGPAPGRGAKIYLGLLVLSAVMIGITGHLGGELTHGEGFITRPLQRIFTSGPGPIAATDPAAYGISQASLDTYLATIQPIFDKRCIDCHGVEDAEDDVRLDALGFVLDPSLEIIERGDPDASELVYLIELPHGDPDLMPPPDEGDPLEPAQIEAIRRWIASLDG